ncbi:hypothetical protein [Alkalimonas mucilaginosa]|uniref:Uncharacterized protein n=1 Tax=Alkalimonas mucilaginosa TaxID=3057676 RepID=A0ABU7JKA1_9GAMM|nr:hypothetical protein [Alkalimonas sp. MEB004]MEE2026127.1 hypothetical protein [Alkalimonas sp. MEB004]
MMDCKQQRGRLAPLLLLDSAILALMIGHWQVFGVHKTIGNPGSKLR